MAEVTRTSGVVRAAIFVFVWNAGLKRLCSRFKWADKTVVRAEKSSFGLFSWKIKWHALNDQQAPFWSPTDVRWHLLLLDLSPIFFTNKRSSVQDESPVSKVKKESWQIELKRKSSSTFFKIFAAAFDFLVNFLLHLKKFYFALTTVLCLLSHLRQGRSLFQPSILDK